MKSQQSEPCDNSLASSALPSVLIVASNTSAKFGGEAVLPLHYFRELRARGAEAWLVTHARVREELKEELAEDISRVAFVEDSALHRLLWRASTYLPNGLRDPFNQLTLGMVTQFTARRLACALIREHRISIVHQPTPVSPKAVSMMFAMGAPVIIGPMNGGMLYPPAFRRAFESSLTGGLVAVGRVLSNLANVVVPGKLMARELLVANARTKAALPKLRFGSVKLLVENGVREPRLGGEGASLSPRTPSEFRLVFVGRLTKWKGVHLLLPAFARLLAAQRNAALHIVGDGEEMAALREQVEDLKIGDRVVFHGFLPNRLALEIVASSSAFVLPSLFECGGAVVLEAMLAGVPVIASNWGGPADYLDETCGILVDPTTPIEFEDALLRAMSRLAESPDLCQEMGKCGRQKALGGYTWSKKIDDIIRIYRSVLSAGE